MGILVESRAFLVATLGARIKDLGADQRALRDLIMKLERTKAELLRAIEIRERECEYLKSHAGGSPQIADMEADIAEGKVELDRLVAGIAEAQAVFASASGKVKPTPPAEKPGE